MSQKKHEQIWRATALWLGLGAVVGWSGSAAPIARADCDESDRWLLTDPVVTVLAGPGDPVAELERWEGWRLALSGTDHIGDFDSPFNLEIEKQP